MLNWRLHHEVQIGGVLVSPFAVYLLIAFVAFVLLRQVFARLRFSRYVANPPLAEAAIYLCVLALVVALF